MWYNTADYTVDLQYSYWNSMAGFRHDEMRRDTMYSNSSSVTTVFEQSHMHQQSAVQDKTHAQHMQQPRYTEAELDYHQICRTVFLTNLPRHLHREQIFTTLSQITQREVKKFDLPNQNMINGEFNKGFAYLHLKSEYRTRALLKKKFIRLGGNKCLIHPYRDHRQGNVLPRDHFKASDQCKNEEMMRNRINTGDSGIVWGAQSPPLKNQKKFEKLETIVSPEYTQNTTSISATGKTAFQDLVTDLQSNHQHCLVQQSEPKKAPISQISPISQNSPFNPQPLDDTSLAAIYKFARLTPNQRTMFYEQFSKDKGKPIDEQIIEPLEQSVTYEKMVQHYLDVYKEISSDHKLWTSELHQFARINGFSFDYVVDILKQHKQRTVQR